MSLELCLISGLSPKYIGHEPYLFSGLSETDNSLPDDGLNRALGKLLRTYKRCWKSIEKTIGSKN
jgi:hypothetical protein